MPRPQRAYEVALEGHVLPALEDGRPMMCDECTNELSEGEEISIYCADLDYSADDMHLDYSEPSRVYCSECTRERIQFPTTKSEEILLSGKMSHEVTPKGLAWTFVDVDTIDYSPRGDGIPWDPAQVWSLVFDFRLREMTEEIDSENYTPEDVVVQLDVFGFDITEFVNYNGNITKSKSEFDKMRDERLSGDFDFPWDN